MSAIYIPPRVELNLITSFVTYSNIDRIVITIIYNYNFFIHRYAVYLLYKKITRLINMFDVQIAISKCKILRDSSRCGQRREINLMRNVGKIWKFRIFRIKMDWILENIFWRMNIGISRPTSSSNTRSVARKHRLYRRKNSPRNLGMPVATRGGKEFNSSRIP